VNELEDDAVATLLAEDPGGPVVMLNLLRFRPDGGRETYQGQAWDMVVLVRYPSRQHFAAMTRDPDYREHAHLRSDALVEAVLQPTVPVVQVAA
jgi:hypothetical protein